MSTRPRKFQAGGANPPYPAAVGASTVPTPPVAPTASGSSATNLAAAAPGDWNSIVNAAPGGWQAVLNAAPSNWEDLVQKAGLPQGQLYGILRLAQTNPQYVQKNAYALPGWEQNLLGLGPGSSTTGGTTGGTASGGAGTTSGGSQQQNPGPLAQPSDQQLAIQNADRLRAAAAALGTGPTPVGGAAAQAAQTALGKQSPQLANPLPGFARGGKAQRFQSGGQSGAQSGAQSGGGGAQQQNPEQAAMQQLMQMSERQLALEQANQQRAEVTAMQGMARGGRIRRFQSGGVNDGTQTTTGGTQTSGAPASTAPSGSNVDYFSLTPAQQQAYGNGDPNYMQAGQAASSAAAPASPGYNYNPYVPPSQNPAAPAGYVAVPFGTGTSVVPSGATAAANFVAMNNSPFMTPAAIQNQAIMGNAGLPGSLQGNATVSVGNQQVPWASMTPEQQYVYEALLGTGQAIPSDFMSAYQGPNASWNNPSLNTLGVPQGSQIVNGALVNTPTGATSPGGIGTSPGTFVANAAGAGVGTGSGATGTTPVQATPQVAQVAQSPTGAAGSGSGLGFRKGGKMAQHRPRRFQAGGFNAAPGGGNWQQALQQMIQNAGAQQGGVGQFNPNAGQLPTGPGFGGFTGLPAPGAAGTGLGGMSPQQAMMLLNGGNPVGMGGAQGMGAAAGAMPPSPGAAAMGAMAGASPGMGQPRPMSGAAPGTAAAGMGAMAGAMPGSPGAAAMGALAGASPGSQPGGQNWMQVLQALQALRGGAGPGMGGTFGPVAAAPGAGAGPGTTFGPSATPSQQWGQMLLGSAPGTGLMNQQNAANPMGQQALWRNYLGQLAGGLGMTGGPGMTGQGMAEGGEVDEGRQRARVAMARGVRKGAARTELAQAGRRRNMAEGGEAQDSEDLEDLTPEARRAHGPAPGESGTWDPDSDNYLPGVTSYMPQQREEYQNWLKDNEAQLRDFYQQSKSLTASEGRSPSGIRWKDLPDSQRAQQPPFPSYEDFVPGIEAYYNRNIRNQPGWQNRPQAPLLPQQRATGGTVDESPKTHATGVPMSRRKATGGVTDALPKRHASGVPMRKATGGITDTAPTRHASGAPMSRAPKGGQPSGTVSKFDSTKGAPGNLHTTAAGRGRGRGFRRGGAVSNRTLDSTKPAPGNLATSQAGRDRFADGGVAAFAAGGAHEAVQPRTSKTVLRRRPAAMPHSPMARGGSADAGRQRARVAMARGVRKGAARQELAQAARRRRLPTPTPPFRDQDNEDAMDASAAPSPAPPPVGPPPPGPPPPFAKGGAVCASCGKAHGGACKGMARGGKFAGAMQRTIRRAGGGKWIQDAIQRPGALRARLHVPAGENIPAGKLAKAAAAPGRLGKQARLAQTLRGFKHAKGGAAACPDCGKAHGGSCKMAAGGVAKVRRGFPNTLKAPKRLARGGTVRGGGAAKRGLKFSGVF